MDNVSEKIVVVSPEETSRTALSAALGNAGYELAAFTTAREALDAMRGSGADLLILDTTITDTSDLSPREAVATVRGSAATDSVRVIVIVGASPERRAAGLDLGAHDALSQPWDAVELRARVRVQLRIRRADAQLLDKMRIAEEGQQIAHTAFEALAVTEKMAADASSVERRLKIGVTVFVVTAAVMAGIYFLFARSAQKDVQHNNATVARLEGSLFLHQQDLAAQVRKLREEQGSSGELVDKDDLQKQAADLKARMASAGSDQSSALQKELDDTNARLKRVEQEGDSAENVIRADVQSVCLLHVSVAFTNKETGQRLRYAGLNQQGEPLQGSDGNPILTLEGNGPEVKVDVFGTGFPAGAADRIITNRHVAEPWWNNDELSNLTSQGLQAEISSIHAYFPGDPRAFTADIQDISKDADLATMRVETNGLRRPPLSIDAGKEAAVTGEPIVLMGYATGLAAILARTDDSTVQQIMTSSGGDVTRVLDELARRNLIHPIITQGHIGDVLPDKIVFDAQTTSGGSGGPLFNQQGKVIGVTYAVLKGFGGSNFGIPIRFSEPLLESASSHGTN